MGKLNDLMKPDISFARDLYCYLFNDTDIIVFVHEPEYRIFYVFGSTACRLNQIITRLGLEILYPISSIDEDLYYEIQDDNIYYLLHKLINDEQKIQIL